MGENGHGPHWMCIKCCVQNDTGHDETVAYLLQHRVVSSNQKNMVCSE